MRSRDELQRAHDILAAIIEGEVPVPEELREHTGGRALTDRQQRDVLWPLLGVLCWALADRHSDAFGDFLADLDRGLAQLGFELKRQPIATRRRMGEG